MDNEEVKQIGSGKNTAFDWFSTASDALSSIANISNQVKNNNKPEPAPAKDNTMLYVGVGAVLLIVGLIVYVKMKK